MSILDDLGGYLDQARGLYSKADSIVRDGEALHRQLSGGARSKSARPAPAVEVPLQGIKFGAPVLVGIVVLVVIGVAVSARR